MADRNERSTGSELIRMFQERGSRANKIDKAYVLIQAATPDDVPGVVMLQHADALIRAAERAAGAPEPEPSARMEWAPSGAGTESAGRESGGAGPAVVETWRAEAADLDAAAEAAIEQSRRATA